MSSLLTTSSLLIKFQRDLNRTNDSERNTRKKGLQKLLEEIPWNKKSQREELKEFVYNHLLIVLLPHISDSIEKCREFTIEIIKKCLEKCNDMSYNHLYELTNDLCNRINENPFPESAEEIRLLILEALSMIYNHQTLILLSKERDNIADIIIQTLCKSLSDGFPAVKRISSELICLLSASSPAYVRTYYKSLLKNLQLNASHQHSKTRSITLQAIGHGLICLAPEDYIQLTKEHILSIFLRTVSDRTPIVRSELAVIVSNIISYRIKHCLYNIKRPLEHVDYELVVILFLLHGDSIDEVAIASKQQLKHCIQYWNSSLIQDHSNVIDICINNNNVLEIVDAELAMQSSSTNATIDDTTNIDMVEVLDVNTIEIEKLLCEFATTHLNDILPILFAGVQSWTSDSRIRYLKALDHFLSYATEESLTISIQSQLLSIIAMQIRDEEADVRFAAQQCCIRIGIKCSMIILLDLLLPVISGSSSTSVVSDTTSKRANMIAVFTYIIEGFSTNKSFLPQTSLDNYTNTTTTSNATNDIEVVVDNDGVSALYVCTMIATCISDSSLYIQRDVVLREATLLFIRKVINTFRIQIMSSPNILEQLLYGLLFLNAKCPGEEDVIPEVAHKELSNLSNIIYTHHHYNDHNNNTSSCSIAYTIGIHFLYLLKRIIYFDEEFNNTTTNNIATNDFNIKVQWEPSSPALGAFTILIRKSPEISWKHQDLLMPIFVNMVQPKAMPIPGSAEANALSYASQRGEEVINTNIGLVDVRLNLIALLEGFIRAGTSNWQCSRDISNACEVIIKHIIIPNLIWRVGKVEATVRKVALATSYGLLKAGAIQPEVLFKNASELVPLIVSHLDDFEVTPRQMACLCITVLFERLRGVFSEQSIREIYPKLLTRLDDSDDYIRISICDTIIMFLQCAANKHCYSGTTIDYMLDQLFIHLDDSNPDMQQAVLKAIVQASVLDKALVIKKAENNRMNHRTTIMCDKVLVEVTGIEILED